MCPDACEESGILPLHDAPFPLIPWAARLGLGSQAHGPWMAAGTGGWRYAQHLCHSPVPALLPWRSRGQGVRVQTCDCPEMGIPLQGVEDHHPLRGAFPDPWNSSGVGLHQGGNDIPDTCPCDCGGDGLSIEGLASMWAHLVYSSSSTSPPSAPGHTPSSSGSFTSPITWGLACHDMSMNFTEAKGKISEV